MSLTKFTEKYVNKKESYIFTEKEIRQESHLITGKEHVETLEVGKQYFMKDYEGYTDFYMVIKEDEETITMIPLWYDTEDTLKSGESDDELVLAFTVSLPKKNLKAVSEHLNIYDWTAPEKLSVDDFWLIGADDWVQSSFDSPSESSSKALLEETYALTVAK